MRFQILTIIKRFSHECLLNVPSTPNFYSFTLLFDGGGLFTSLLATLNCLSPGIVNSAEVSLTEKNVTNTSDKIYVNTLGMLHTLM